MRNLVVCLDGTWNTPDQVDRGRQVPSNVVKMARAVKEGRAETDLEQKVYYDTGVGTKGWRDKLVGGVTGKGIGKNIREAYEWLTREFQPEDRIFLFGFSRGAYTARSLAGLLGLCGLPQPENADAVQEAIDLYRMTDHARRRSMAETFRQKHNVRPGDVHFIGVWDTVGALGVPVGFLKRKLAGLTEFHDVTLGGHIRHACHALAINERRGPFKPTLWDPNNLSEGQTLLQSWFPGVHSNIGGGYSDTGLSDRAFLWMLGNAYARGLRPDDQYVRLRIHPNWFGELRDSCGRKYKMMFWNKPADRVVGSTRHDSECLHISGIERWKHASAPEEEPDNFSAARDAGMKTAYASTWEREFNLESR